VQPRWPVPIAASARRVPLSHARLERGRRFVIEVRSGLVGWVATSAEADAVHRALTSGQGLPLLHRGRAWHFDVSGSLSAFADQPRGRYRIEEGPEYLEEREIKRAASIPGQKDRASGPPLAPVVATRV
jgi:hypothetical protein